MVRERVERMDISVVLPIYNERDNIKPLLVEIEEALDPTGKSYEIIAVDDGSDDGSSDLLKKLTSEHPRLRAIFFRKNSGQAAAFDAASATPPAMSSSRWTPTSRMIRRTSPASSRSSTPASTW
jgi:GT2 family glycosyltransferase